MTPAVLGLAAAAGYDELTAYRRPRAEVLVLGDELLEQRAAPGRAGSGTRSARCSPPGCARWASRRPPPRHLADDADTLYAAIAESTADVVITTGGTASGPVDHVHPTLRRLGAEVLVDGVAVRPGHPMLLARLAPRRHLVGLPGNPLAAVSGLLHARRTAAPYARRPPRRPRRTVRRWPPPSRGIRRTPGSSRWPTATTTRHGLTAAPLHFHGPAMLRGIAAADALAVVPPGGAERGTELELLELPWSAGWSTEWSPGWTAPRGRVRRPRAPGGRPTTSGRSAEAFPSLLPRERLGTASLMVITRWVSSSVAACGSA